jgi:hypothetical protein
VLANRPARAAAPINDSFMIVPSPFLAFPRSGKSSPGQSRCRRLF